MIARRNTQVIEVSSDFQLAQLTGACLSNARYRGIRIPRESLSASLSL